MTGYATGLHNKEFTTSTVFPWLLQGGKTCGFTCETKQVLSITVAARAWCVVSGSAAPVLGVEVGIEFMPYKNSLCSGCPMLSPALFNCWCYLRAPILSGANGEAFAQTAAYKWICTGLMGMPPFQSAACERGILGLP